MVNQEPKEPFPRLREQFQRDPWSGVWPTKAGALPASLIPTFAPVCHVCSGAHSVKLCAFGQQNDTPSKSHLNPRNQNKHHERGYAASKKPKSYVKLPAECLACTTKKTCSLRKRRVAAKARHWIKEISNRRWCCISTNNFVRIGGCTKLWFWQKELRNVRGFSQW